MNEEAMRAKIRNNSSRITDERIALKRLQGDEERLIGARRTLDQWIEEVRSQSSLVWKPQIDPRWKGREAFYYQDDVRMRWQDNQQKLKYQFEDAQGKIDSALSRVRTDIATKSKQISLLSAEIDSLYWSLRMV
ncbi:DUF5082 family protein [Shouchella lonarensis]|uniref:Uncharacterized protein n=1 Tax=Shouchella lonarensis TaxID=1464122 RepID=A0A1G6IJZ5_9BACI|nr:DUF5082 family protein [Shouchella lonarensis]SDC06743.1 protein of unknown function [Shouchella lonarensis]